MFILKLDTFSNLGSRTLMTLALWGFACTAIGASRPASMASHHEGLFQGAPPRNTEHTNTTLIHLARAQAASHVLSPNYRKCS